MVYSHPGTMLLSVIERSRSFRVRYMAALRASFLFPRRFAEPRFWGQCIQFLALGKMQHLVLPLYSQNDSIAKFLFCAQQFPVQSNRLILGNNFYKLS
jgi:hypothetical protein